MVIRRVVSVSVEYLWKMEKGMIGSFRVADIVKLCILVSNCGHISIAGDI